MGNTYTLTFMIKPTTLGLALKQPKLLQVLFWWHKNKYRQSCKVTRC